MMRLSMPQATKKAEASAPALLEIEPCQGGTGLVRAKIETEFQPNEFQPDEFQPEGTSLDRPGAP